MAGVNPVIHPSSNGPSAEAMGPRVTPGGDASRKPGDPSAHDLNVVPLLCDHAIVVGMGADPRSGFRRSDVDVDSTSAVTGVSSSPNRGRGA
jgi:hypothetical protein